MSADYPDREVWLAKRCGKRVARGRYIHVSKKLAVIPLPQPHLVVSSEPGITYRRSR